MWPLPRPLEFSESENVLLRRMSGLASLSDPELDVLREVTLQPSSAPPQTEFCVEGRVLAPRVLLSGWACYQRILGDGRRQIVSFVLPGDFIGSITRSALPASQTAMALTPVVTADARPLLTALDGTAPGLAEAMLRMGYAEDVRMRDHVVRLGRQTAYERVVHLMLEFHSRLDAVGLVLHDGFAVPVTQEVLADALGLSVVHINRTLQQIRRDNLFELRFGRIKLRQIELMQALVDWSPPAT